MVDSSGFFAAMHIVILAAEKNLHRDLLEALDDLLTALEDVL